MKKPEITAPAGNREKLETALDYGADAVYAGTGPWNLRSNADNFSLAELRDAIHYTHDRKKKIYITLNSYLYTRDINPFTELCSTLATYGPDAFIITDPAALEICRANAPAVPLHLSTQANTTSAKAALFWARHGVSRIILARELHIDEIRSIRRDTDIELELFVHGAMCMALSGRCLLSDYLNGRSANRGDCSHPCRYTYNAVPDQPPGDFILAEHAGGTAIMNAKDLNTIAHIPELVRSGVDAFKIEGRMKSVHYLATTLKAYRSAIDRFCEDPEAYTPDPAWERELAKVSVRSYTEGFYFRDTATLQTLDAASYAPEFMMVGVVREVLENGSVVVEGKNRIRAHEIVELFSKEKNATLHTFRLDTMLSVDGRELAAAHANSVFITRLPCRASKGSILRKHHAPRP